MQIALIDSRPEIGAGVAYATRDYPYPLNVAAEQMSVDGGRPGNFLDYLKTQEIHASRRHLPRQVYSDYLRARFAEARAAAPKTVECVHHRASAWQLRRNDDRWLLLARRWHAAACRRRGAGARQSAAGNSGRAANLANSPRYVSDPWSIGSSRIRKTSAACCSWQRPYDGRRGAAAGRLASARQAHSRAVASWLDAGITGLGAIARNQARRSRTRGGSRFDARPRAGLRTLTETVDNAGSAWREELGSRAGSWRTNGARLINRSARDSSAALAPPGT